MNVKKGHSLLPLPYSFDFSQGQECCPFGVRLVLLVFLCNVPYYFDG